MRHPYRTLSENPEGKRSLGGEKEKKTRLHTLFFVFPHFIFGKHYMFRLSSAIIRCKQSKVKIQVLKTDFKNNFDSSMR
jgi:hypothetical protein